MTNIVQLCGCFDTGESVIPLVSNELAQFYGVYIGKPGEFVWHADFHSREYALNYAMDLARTQGLALHDATYSDGGSK